MVRRLEHRTFFDCVNNGVAAIAGSYVRTQTERSQEIERCISKTVHNSSKAIQSALSHLITPIFTFVTPERFEKSPWHYGDHYLLNALEAFIRDEGGKIIRRQFYVPFSNGLELGLHGVEAMQKELSFVATPKQFEDVFGVTEEEVMVLDL